MRQRTTSVLARIAVLSLAATFAACSDTTGAAPAHFTASPTPVPTATPNPATTTSTLSTTASTVFAPISEGGYTEVMTLPPVTPAISVTETISAGVPQGATALSRLRASAGSARGIFSTVHAPLAVRRASDNAGEDLANVTPLAYLDVMPAAAATGTGTIVFSFTLPALASGVTYNLASYDEGSWTADPFGSTISGTTVTFTIPTATQMFSASQPFILALYSEPSAPTVSPAALTFDATQPGTTQTVSVTEAGDTTAYTAEIDTCTAATPEPNASPTPTPSADPYAFIVTFSGGSATASATPVNGTATFSLTGGDLVGTCSVIVSDGDGQTSTVTVNVDQTNAGIFSTHRVQH